MDDAFHKLTSATLSELASALKDDEGSVGLSSNSLRQIVGSTLQIEIQERLSELQSGGWSSPQIGQLAQTIADTRKTLEDPEALFDLVLSGPAVEGVPTRDTSAVMHQLIEDAEEEVILIGYAVYNGKKLFERLARRMKDDGLNVWFCLNIERKWKDTSLSSELVRRFMHEFKTKHWPGDTLPTIYYDPRALELSGPTKASLHAKCLIVDRKVALITSANFTEAAQQRNIEAGVIVNYQPFVQRIATYFDGLKEKLLMEAK
ncbi:MAG: DISARM system phospholipase D-like protein DrmC [Planctomycetota bacterium]|nr:DISARM system phospholipase D-like protein DrmC [Planctomycetota bacterium]MDA1143084.1 DISARM system phospholipase D-like protein DrmC [Planctomycetota bacterium]